MNGQIPLCKLHIITTLRQALAGMISTYEPMLRHPTLAVHPCTWEGLAAPTQHGCRHQARAAGAQRPDESSGTDIYGVRWLVRAGCVPDAS